MHNTTVISLSFVRKWTGLIVQNKQYDVAFSRHLKHGSPPIILSRNLQVDSFFPDELYQGYITGLPAGRWWTIQLPFRDMTLTRLGRLSYIQKELDSTFALESIGFLVADGKPGPFRLEIGGVKAVGRVEGRPLDVVVGGGEGGAGRGTAEGELREGMKVDDEAGREAKRRSEGRHEGPS